MLRRAIDLYNMHFTANSRKFPTRPYNNSNPIRQQINQTPKLTRTRGGARHRDQPKSFTRPHPTKKSEILQQRRSSRPTIDLDRNHARTREPSAAGGLGSGSSAAAAAAPSNGGLGSPAAAAAYRLLARDSAPDPPGAPSPAVAAPRCIFGNARPPKGGLSMAFLGRLSRSMGQWRNWG